MEHDAHSGSYLWQMIRSLSQRYDDERGQSAVEWAMITALVTVVSTAILGTIGTSVVAFGTAHALIFLIAGGTLLGVGALGTGGYFAALRPALRRRALAKVDRALLESWATRLEPGAEGPYVPEEGYELLVPVKRRELDGQDVSLRFAVALYRFANKDWKLVNPDVKVGELAHLTKPRQEAWSLTRLFRREHQSALPSAEDFEKIEGGLRLVWPTATPIEELAAAWFDFSERVRTRNRMQWASQLDQQAEDRARRELLSEQLKVAELLPGETLDDPRIAQLAQSL
jgi:Flp pilus assembly pilin Flp